MTEVLIVCGVGGAGKTTTSAALGLAAALAGRRVALLTIDPARRLADALGLPELGNTPTPLRLPDDAPPGARLDALMLDRKATWDDLVRAQAPDPATAERLLASRYYRALSERLSGGHEYMATEKLYALANDGTWDLVIVDTPPSQHALDFFQAPDRIRRILDQRALAALLRPSTGLVGLATRGAVDLIRRLAGEQVMDDLTEFFELVAGLAEGLRARGQAVRELLRSPACGFVLVTNARAPQEEEVTAFVMAVREQGLALRGFVVNRATPATDPALQTPPAPPPGADAQTWADALAALTAARDRQDARARADEKLATGLASAWRTRAWRVPDAVGGVDDLRALAALARHLPPLAP